MQVSSVVTSLPVQPSQPAQETRATTNPEEDNKASNTTYGNAVDKASTTQGVGRYMDITA